MTDILFSVKTIDLKKHLFKDSKIIPLYSNYLCEFSILKPYDSGKVVEIYGKFNDTNITISQHLRVKGIRKNCYLLFNWFQFQELYNTDPELVYKKVIGITKSPKLKID